MQLSRIPLATFVFLTGLLISCSQPAAPTADTGHAERHTAYFDEADADHSGAVETDEIDAVANADFGTLDYNSSGTVTIEDVYNADQGEPAGATRNLNLSSHLPFDTNGDGSITRGEHRAYLDKTIVAKMDADGDNRINFDEYRAYEGF